MTDYLIDRYNQKIADALDKKDTSIAKATQLWHDAVDSIIMEWQSVCAEAAVELTMEAERRNREYVEGPPPAPTEKAKPPDETIAPPSNDPAPTEPEIDRLPEAPMPHLADALSQ